MQNRVVSYAKKLFLPASLSLTMLMTGCGADKESDEAKKYDVAQAMDQGNWDEAISMLEKDCAGYSDVECKINLGASYLGKAGFDIIGIGTDLMAIDGNDSASDTWKEQKTTESLFDKLFNDYMQQGIQYFKLVLPKDYTQAGCSASNDAEYAALPDANKSKCADTATYCKKGTAYDENLTYLQQQACISINPILLQELMSEEETVSTNAVDMETLIEFKSIAEAAIPGLTTTELVDMVSGSGSLGEKDINENGTPDQLEVTNCVITNINGNSTASCEADGISFRDDLNETDVTIGSNEFNVSRVTMAGSGDFAGQTKNFARLWKSQVAGNTTVTSLDSNVTADGNTACADAFVSSCYPAPKVVDGGVTTFGDTAVNIINNDAVIKSLAELSDTSDAKTSDQKVADLKTDLCGSASCTATQEQVLSYMSSDK